MNPNPQGKEREIMFGENIKRISAPLLVLGAVEGVAIICSFYVGVMISWVKIEEVFVYPSEFLVKSIMFTTILLFMMFSLGLYHDRFFATFADMTVRLVVSMFFGAIVLSVLFYVFPKLMIWRNVMAMSMIIAFFSIMITRFAALRVADVHFVKRKVVVIGVGERASRIDALEREKRAFGFICIGYVVDAGDNAREAKVRHSRIFLHNELLENVVSARNVDEIVVAVEDRRGHLPMKSLMECRSRGVAVTDYMDFYERETGSVDLDALTPSWFVLCGGFPSGLVHRLVKRTVDVGMSLLFLLFLLPLMVATAAAIRLEGRGPIMHRQTRVGLNGRPFVLFKFRSMQMNAESDGVPRWAASSDPRTTAVGAFIRRFRIDETPQLFNVLQGKMSFVGPRPERPHFVDQLATEIASYSERHRVKPGITGWAQLNFNQNTDSLEDAMTKFQYDLYYVKYYSVLLDMIIILQTVRVILWPNGESVNISDLSGSTRL